MTGNEFVGKTLEEAKQIAYGANMQVVVETDGLQQLNCEYRSGRINLKVVNGIVTSARIG
jgi:hypothetical protein